MHIGQWVTVCKLYSVTQDAQTEEVQGYFCQWGPVNSCQLAHNDSALIALIAQQGHLQVPNLTRPCPRPLSRAPPQHPMACSSNLQGLSACCGAAVFNMSCSTLGAMSHCVTDTCPRTALYLCLQKSPGARHTCAVFLNVSVTRTDN